MTNYIIPCLFLLKHYLVLPWNLSRIPCSRVDSVCLNSDKPQHFQIQTWTFSNIDSWTSLGRSWKRPLSNTFGGDELHSNQWGEEMAT